MKRAKYDTKQQGTTSGETLLNTMAVEWAIIKRKMVLLGDVCTHANGNSYWGFQPQNDHTQQPSMHR